MAVMGNSKAAHPAVPNDRSGSSTAATPLLLRSNSPPPPQPRTATDNDIDITDRDGADRDLLPSYEEDDPAGRGEEPPPFSRYRPTTHTIANERVVSHDAHLNSDVEALYQWMHDEAAQRPPRPLLHIEGTHRVCTTRSRDSSSSSSSHPSSSSSTVTDFSIYFDLSSLMEPGFRVVAADPDEPRLRGTRRPCTAHQAAAHTSDVGAVTEAGSKDVRDWCADYIDCRSSWKEFVMRKRVAGIDEAALRRHVECVVRATNYRGALCVRFPVARRTVLLAPDRWVCRIRYGWARWLVYLSCLWLLTWPLLWARTRRWDVVDSRFAACPGAESRWAKRWAKLLMRLIHQRRQDGPSAALTPQHLRWLELQEYAADQERLAHARSSPRAWADSLLRGLTGFESGEFGEWGADEW